MPKHVFFDMDGTITRSRSPVEAPMRDALVSLKGAGTDVIIISGQSVDAIRSQVGVGSLYMGQNGNHAVTVEGEELWHDRLTDSEKKIIHEHIAAILTALQKTDTYDLIEDRESQISFSVLGHHTPIETKELYDPTKEVRSKLLQTHPLVSDSVEVMIAGTTTLDYMRKGRHKGYNIERLITRMNWQKEDCLYVGDALFPGGNDEVVIGVIETMAVSNPEETLRFVQTLL